MCGIKDHIANYINSEFERKWTLTNEKVPQTFSLTSTKPLWYVTITILILGCPVNHGNNLSYGRKCLCKLVQERNAIN